MTAVHIHDIIYMVTMMHPVCMKTSHNQSRKCAQRPLLTTANTVHLQIGNRTVVCSYTAEGQQGQEDWTDWTALNFVEAQ